MITKYFSTLKKPKIVVIDSNDDKLKVLQLLRKSVFRKSILVVGTHNGIFHSDEVVACAMLYLTGGFKEIWIIRTRDEEILKKCDICVDVGGGVYDHHTEKKFRSNGKIYASAGLVWNDFGRSLLKKTLMKYFSEFKIDLAVAFKTFDEEIIQVVDYEDNGVPCDRQNPFNYITAFHPRWDKTSPQDFNRQFKKVLEITISVLEEQLKDCLSRVYSKATLLERWNNPEFFQNGILEIPSQTFKWQIPCIEINDTITDEAKKINFVIFKHPSGDWAAQCVALNKKDLFGRRIPFPKAWAGLFADKLPEVSGVETATFCHLGCFFVRAKNKQDVIKMCKIAMGINA